MTDLSFSFDDSMYFPKQCEGFTYLDSTNTIDADTEKEIKVDMNSIDKNITEEIDESKSMIENIVIDFYRACYGQPYTIGLFKTNKDNDTIFFIKLKNKLKTKYNLRDSFNMDVVDKTVFVQIPDDIQIYSFTLEQGSD